MSILAWTWKCCGTRLTKICQRLNLRFERCSIGLIFRSRSYLNSSGMGLLRLHAAREHLLLRIAEGSFD